MPLYKTDIPDMYNEIPFPEGYFDDPRSRKSEGKGGYNLSMAIDYADLENKDVKRCSASEMSMFKTIPAVGGLMRPEMFARYLENAYTNRKRDRAKIRTYSLRYVAELPFTQKYLDKILPEWAMGETTYDFIVAEFLHNRLKIGIDDFSHEQMQVLRTDSDGKPMHMKEMTKLLQGGWKNIFSDEEN